MTSIDGLGDFKLEEKPFVEFGSLNHHVVRVLDKKSSIPCFTCLHELNNDRTRMSRAPDRAEASVEASVDQDGKAKVEGKIVWTWENEKSDDSNKANNQQNKSD